MARTPTLILALLDVYLRLVRLEWTRIAEEPLTVEPGCQEVGRVSINAFGSVAACMRLYLHFQQGELSFSAARNSWYFHTPLEALVGVKLGGSAT